MTRGEGLLCVNVPVDTEDEVEDVIWWVNVFESINAVGSFDLKLEWGEVFFSVENLEQAKRVLEYVAAWDGESIPW